MDGSTPQLLLLLYVVFLLITAIVYQYSAAIQNISEAELYNIQKKNKKIYKKIEKVIQKPLAYVNTVQVVTVADIFVAGLYVSTKTHNPVVCVCLGAGLILLEMVLGILISKKIGGRTPEKTAKRFATSVHVFVIVLKPITFIISVLADGILFLFGIDPKEPEENVTEEDIISVINEGHEQGVLLASEAEMINNIVEFGDKEAKDIMTHRTEIVAVDGKLTLKEAADYIIQQNKSRFPVYDGDIDNIIGIVNFRDIMTESVRETEQNQVLCKIPGLMRKATYIPETKKINVLFKSMQSEKNHMVIVVDEYGQTSGIVAMEDILEEIVGNILDEYDEDDRNISRKEDGSYIVKGRTTLLELQDEIGMEFDEDCETINGYLTTKLERILSNDERPELVINNIKYKILNVENRMISVVQIFLMDAEGLQNQQILDRKEKTIETNQEINQAI